MGTRVSLMSNIGYTPSYKPRNPKPLPKLLDDEESWELLVSDVQKFIQKEQKKNRGKGEVAPFSIRLTDMSNVDEPSSKTGGKKVPLC